MFCLCTRRGDLAVDLTFDVASSCRVRAQKEIPSLNRSGRREMTAAAVKRRPAGEICFTRRIRLAFSRDLKEQLKQNKAFQRTMRPERYPLTGPRATRRTVSAVKVRQ